MRAIQSICLMFIMMLASYAAPAAESGSPTLTGEGWTVETQGDRGRLTIKYERLGTILREVRLNLEANGVLQEMTQLKAEVTGPVPMVWCSWSSYFADATEADVVKNVDWLAEHLRPYGFQNVTIDDGYPALHHFPGVNGFLSGIQGPPIGRGSAAPFILAQDQ